jgi:arginyl-tRNA synthetase
LHIGHGRQAALGDALANLLKTQGFSIYKEFYYNDAGVQIQTLAQSVQMRAKGLNPGDEGWPEAAYNGEYIADIARDYIDQKSVQVKDIGHVKAKGDIEDFSAIKDFAVAYLRAEQDKDLAAFGVTFDEYYLESSLYTTKRVQQAVDRLIEQGKCYEQSNEQGCALYLKTTEYGDDKDRVMRKSNGDYTYFVPDIAYHYAKFERGFSRAIDIQGFDHHGTIARVKAGLQALNKGVPENFVDYILHKMVTVMKNGAEVKISKRAGSYVTLRDLIEWSSKDPSLEDGRDVVRFFLLSRKADSEFVFDVDLALQQNDENPVYYVQYAHARICSIIRNAGLIAVGENGSTTPVDLSTTDLSLLTHEKEHALLKHLSAYSETLSHAAREYAPHLIAFYVRELSSLFHSFYNSCKIIQDDVQLMQARLILLKATQLVLQNALNILGIRSPEKM